MKFSSAEEFDLHVHKCFGRMFELLTKVDSLVREGADKDEAAKEPDSMNDLRDWVEEIILHAHLAWQYHRLSMGARKSDTWDQVEKNQADSE